RHPPDRHTQAGALGRARLCRDPAGGARGRRKGCQYDRWPRRERRIRRSRLAHRRHHPLRRTAARALACTGDDRRGGQRARARRTGARLPARSNPMTTAIAAPRAPFDRTLLLILPAAAFMVLLFVYPFLYGLMLSFEPKEGGALANYR